MKYECAAKSADYIQRLPSSTNAEKEVTLFYMRYRHDIQKDERGKQL